MRLKAIVESFRVPLLAGRQSNRLFFYEASLKGTRLGFRFTMSALLMVLTMMLLMQLPEQAFVQVVGGVVGAVFLGGA